MEFLPFAAALSRDQPQSKFAFLKRAGFSVIHPQTTPRSTPLRLQSPYKSYQENPFLLHTYTAHSQIYCLAPPKRFTGPLLLAEGLTRRQAARGDDFWRWSGFGPEQTGLCSSAEGTPARCAHPASREDPA